MPERDVARVAGEDVPGHRRRQEDHGVDADGCDLLIREYQREAARGQQEDGRQADAPQPRASTAHWALASWRPNRPPGRSASTSTTPAYHPATPHLSYPS